MRCGGHETVAVEQSTTHDEVMTAKQRRMQNTHETRNVVFVLSMFTTFIFNLPYQTSNVGHVIMIDLQHSHLPIRFDAPGELIFTLACLIYNHR